MPDLVIAEWNERLFHARVDPTFGVAIVVAPVVDDDSDSGSSAVTSPQHGVAPE